MDVTKTGNGERGTGNLERGTGLWKRVYSGNPPENSTWRTKEKKREQIGEMRGSVTVVNVSIYTRSCAQYVPARAESDWILAHVMAPGFSNRYYHMLPQSIRPQPFLNRISSLPSLVISSHSVCELSYQYLKTATRNMISRTSNITHDHL